nr:hypothetical protein KPHV_79440 [Kitasatospora purpeofusca]
MGTPPWAIAPASALEIVAVPFWGRLSDRVGRRRVVLAGLLCTAACAHPFFLLLETRSAP